MRLLNSWSVHQFLFFLETLDNFLLTTEISDFYSKGEEVAMQALVNLSHSHLFPFGNTLTILCGDGTLLMQFWSFSDSSCNLTWKPYHCWCWNDIQGGDCRLWRHSNSMKLSCLPKMGLQVDCLKNRMVAQQQKTRSDIKWFWTYSYGNLNEGDVKWWITYCIAGQRYPEILPILRMKSVPGKRLVLHSFFSPVGKSGGSEWDLPFKWICIGLYYL